PGTVVAAPERSCPHALLALAKGDRIGRIAHDQHGIGRLDTRMRLARQEQQRLLRGLWIVGLLGELERAELDHLAALWPRDRRVRNLVALPGDLRIPIEHDGPLPYTREDLILEIGRALGLAFVRLEVTLAGARHEAVAHELGAPLGVGELERVDAPIGGL